MRTHSAVGSRRPGLHGWLELSPYSSSFSLSHNREPGALRRLPSLSLSSFISQLWQAEKKTQRGNVPQISIFLPSTQWRLLSFSFLKAGEREEEGKARLLLATVSECNDLPPSKRLCFPIFLKQVSSQTASTLIRKYLLGHCVINIFHLVIELQLNSLIKKNNYKP